MLVLLLLDEFNVGPAIDALLPLDDKFGWSPLFIEPADCTRGIVSWVLGASLMLLLNQVGSVEDAAVSMSAGMSVRMTKAYLFLFLIRYLLCICLDNHDQSCKIEKKRIGCGLLLSI